MAERKYKSSELEVQKSDFEGVVTEVLWAKGKQFEGSKRKEAPDQLELHIQPTSYTGEERLAWYNYSDIGTLRGGKQTKWAKLLSALEKVGTSIDEAPHEQKIVGNSYHWTEDVEEFDIDGVVKESRTLLPDKYLGHPGVPEKAAAAAPVAEAGKADVDPEILALVKEKPMALTDIANTLEKKGFKKTITVGRVKQLEKAGSVVIDDGKVSVV